jgi:hypothetical protein
MHVTIHEKHGDEFFKVMAWLLAHRGEFKMSQVQFSATFNVVDVTSTLAVTPSSQTFNLTVGKDATGTAAAVVSGGVPPYTYALDSASGPMPTGVTFAEDNSGNITLSGTPTVAGTSTTPVLLNITDAAGSTAQAAFKPRPIS